MLSLFLYYFLYLFYSILLGFFILSLSKKAAKKNDVPVAALIVDNQTGKIISKAYNTRNITQKTLNHAEIIAIQKANKKISLWRLNKCTLYVTIEPCEMCKAIIKESRISQVYYLLEKPVTKQQYNKVKFTKIQHQNEYLKKYQKIADNFWKKLRKMI